MATASLIAGASELARKARVWLGHGKRSKATTLDVVSVSYELETHALTSEGFPFILVAVYTVGGRIDVAAVANKTLTGEVPLLLRDKLVSPPDHVSPGGDCPSRVRKLVQRHVRAVAAGTATAEMAVGEGATNFVKDVLRRVNQDLDKSGALLLYRVMPERLSVQVPSDKLSVTVVDGEEGASAPAPLHLGANQVWLDLSVSLNTGVGTFSMIAVVDAATMAGWEEQIKAAGAGAEAWIAIQGEKTTMRFKLGCSRPTVYHPSAPVVRQ